MVGQSGQLQPDLQAFPASFQLLRRKQSIQKMNVGLLFLYCAFPGNLPGFPTGSIQHYLLLLGQQIFHSHLLCCNFAGVGMYFSIGILAQLEHLCIERLQIYKDSARILFLLQNPQIKYSRSFFRLHTGLPLFSYYS